MPKPVKDLEKTIPTKYQKKHLDFNFGPISRTLGEAGDYLGFASLPIHEAVAALLSACNRDEFIAWLYHDTFKALFNVVIDKKKNPKWSHVPGKFDSANLEPLFKRFAQSLKIDPSLAMGHHFGKMLSEKETITNEFGPLYLGSKARFVQLSFAVQPTAHTIPLRQCITESFLRGVSQIAAKGIASLNLPFSNVLYRFYQGQEKLTLEQIAALYQLNVIDKTLEIVHFIASEEFESTQLSLDLTDKPPCRGNLNAFSLIELLTVYRDELTTIVAIPLFLGNLDNVVKEIRTVMDVLFPKILEKIGIKANNEKMRTYNLQHIILDDMVEVRPIDETFNETYVAMWNGKSTKRLRKSIHKLIQRPYQLMAESSRNLICVVCGTPINQKTADICSNPPRLESIFSTKFTDFEHVGFSGRICPLCLIYANSENKELLRGSQAFLAPSTALNTPVRSILAEQPRFDEAHRFDPARPMPKTVVTLQEMVLLTAISRRIVDALLPFNIEADGHLVNEMQMLMDNGVFVSIGVYLPYSGVYLISNPEGVSVLYRDVLVGSDPSRPCLWQTIELDAYPFRLELSPAFTLLISLQINASRWFSGYHTLLKSHPTQVFLSPNASFNILVDNAFQETVNSELVEAIRLVRQLADMPDLNRKDFINALLIGRSPLEAVYLAAKRLPKHKNKGEAFRLTQARLFWNRGDVADGETTEEQWMKLNELTKQVQSLAQAHPTLLNLVKKTGEI